jgi:murein DD-endopeptidase MepM/ murein hydrolase activator NlpD
MVMNIHVNRQNVESRVKTNNSVKPDGLFPKRGWRWICLALLLPAAGWGAPMDPSLGVCTRKDEFAKRQEAMDQRVAELGAEKDEAKRSPLVTALAEAASADIECLIRYREKHLAPVFAEVLRTSTNWFTRTRAAYALKMIGDGTSVEALAGALADEDPMVRDVAAGALGHLGGEVALAAIEKRRATEQDPYVLATIESALGMLGPKGRPYDSRQDGKVWKETLTGSEGARRVDWVWVRKGANLFNDYDARTLDYPVAGKFVYPIQRYQEDYYAGYPRTSFGGTNGAHAGEDCGWFREGCSVYAVADGLVRMVQGGGGDWGFLVAVEHRLPDGRYLTSTYGHCGWDVLVRVGQVVKAGQRIATQGLSCSVENGGYGAHLHFGLGDGPFRRPAGMATGDVVNLAPGDGETNKAPVLRLVYSATRKNSFGWPKTAFVIRDDDGTERTLDVPEQPIQRELSWLQAYVKGCRGWLNPQAVLPELVEKGTLPVPGRTKNESSAVPNRQFMRDPEGVRSPHQERD